MKTLKTLLLSATLGLALAFSSCVPFFNSNKYLERDGDYNGIVVFSYDDHRLTSKEIEKNKNELINTHYDSNNLPIFSQQEWWSKKAEEYGAKFNLSLDFYPNEIKLTKEFILDGGINLYNFPSYLRKTYPEINNYEFLAIIYEKHGFSGGKSLSSTKSFYIYSSFIVSEKIEQPFIGDNFAHEFAHLGGATDKYNPDDSTNNPDKFDLMRNGSFNQETIGMRNGALTEQVKISEQTARELGWIE